MQQARSIKTSPDSVNERPADTSKTGHKPKLLDRLREALRARHYSRRTEQTYCHWVKRFIFFHKVRHPAEMAEPEINAFLKKGKEIHEKDLAEGWTDKARHLPYFPTFICDPSVGRRL